MRWGVSRARHIQSWCKRQSATIYWRAVAEVKRALRKSLLQVGSLARLLPWAKHRNSCGRWAANWGAPDGPCRALVVNSECWG